MAVRSKLQSKILARQAQLQAKLQTQIQSGIQKTKQVIQSKVPPHLMERADQALLELSHAGQSIPNLLKQTFKNIEGNPNDMIGRLSRTVFERAEAVRTTLRTKAFKGEVATGENLPNKSESPASKPKFKVTKSKPAKSKPAKSKAVKAAAANSKAKKNRSVPVTTALND